MIPAIDIHCIPQRACVLDALRQLNSLPGDSLVLFAIDDDSRPVGALTDGDIRRALVAGASLQTPVSEIMNRNFASFTTLDYASVLESRRLRQRGVTLVPCLDPYGRICRLINFKRCRAALPINAVLMAGGKGERLRPLTEHTPKPLLPVGDKAIIDYNIDNLIDCGVDNICVTVNYLHEQIEDHFITPRKQGVKVKCVREPQYLGTIGSLRFVQGLDADTVLVMNSDLFTNIDFEDFYVHFCHHGADMSVAAVPYSVAVPYGIMDLDGRDLKGIIEKPTYNYYANGGIYLIKRHLLDLIPEGKFFNATDLIDSLLQHGRKVIRYPLNGIWIDIGNPQEYQKAKDLARHLTR